MRGRAIRYSEAELAFVEARKTLSRSALHIAFAEAFARDDVTVHDLKALCTRHGWTTRTRWSADEDAQLRARYPDTRTQDLSRALGRSLTTTYQRAQRLGLTKSEAFRASPASGRTNGRQGTGTRFEKGHAPANKGLRRPGFAPGRMKESQFTKGQNGYNWKPIGSERLVDGYVYTKVSDDRCVPWTVNWKPTHVLRWEAINGPMSKGMALKNLDGNRLNTDPSNWALISRAMLPRLNGGRAGRLSYDDAPSELKPTLLALAKLEQTARERTRRKERVPA